LLPEDIYLLHRHDLVVEALQLFCQFGLGVVEQLHGQQLLVQEIYGRFSLQPEHSQPRQISKSLIELAAGPNHHEDSGKDPPSFLGLILRLDLGFDQAILIRDDLIFDQDIDYSVEELLHLEVRIFLVLLAHTDNIVIFSDFTIWTIFGRLFHFNQIVFVKILDLKLLKRLKSMCSCCLIESSKYDDQENDQLTLHCLVLR
jgi:hypothetical protein